MNNFRKQQLRVFPVTFLILLLLFIAVAFSVIGYAASNGTKQQLDAVESRYTTIGAISDQNAQYMQYDGVTLSKKMDSVYQWTNKNHIIQDDGSIVWDDGTIFYGAKVLENIAKDAPQIRTITRSAILSAHVEETYGLSSGTQNSLQFNEAFDAYSYNMAVFVGRCLSKDYTSRGPTPDYKMEPFIFQPVVDGDYSTKVCFIDDTFYVDEIVSMHPFYEALFKSDRELRATENYMMMPLTDLVEENIVQGKQYIVRCFIKEMPVIQIESRVGDTVQYIYKRFKGLSSDSDDLAVRFFWNRSTTELTRSYTFSYPQLFSLSGVKPQEGIGESNFTLDMKKIGTYVEGFTKGQYYYAIPEDSLPFYAEFEGELEDFLNSEEGQVWRDVIIPMADINQESATVILVEDLDYLHAFNSGKAMITEGRAIEATEFVRGEKVCVISSAYADHADLEVGDSVHLDFYDTEYFITSANIENWDSTSHEFAMVHNPLQEENRIGYEEDYTIVGIYSAPEYEFGSTNFYADTIFVPKASVPNAEEYEDPSLPLLNSVVLMNGTTEEFEAYMESRGFGGYYTYFDKDFSSTISGLQSLSQNVLRLMILAGAVLLVTAILFFYLNYKRMIPVAYGMRRMGQHPFKLWWQMQTVTLPLILIAVFGGAWLGTYFFDYVTTLFLESNILLDTETVKWLTLAEAAGLCIVSLLVAIPVSMPRLMKRR